MRDPFRTTTDEVAKEEGIQLSWLAPEIADALRIRLESAFGRNGEPLTTDGNFAGTSIRADESWEHIADFAWTAEVVLFTNPRRSSEMALFGSLAEAHRLLAEAPPFDFLLTEPGGSFVFAHNGYQKLTGAGTAEAFVEGLREA